ncbi:MAG: hypothetical protein IJY27_02795 [Clostridia bacterium]|nr:hypothetical protein [Clostridia bacterium]
MKKYIVKIVVLALVVTTLCCCFVSCGNKLGGTYICEDSAMYVSYKFSLFSDKLVMSVYDISFNGTYEIDDDKIYITIAEDRREHTYSKDGKTIYIDGKAYVKE